MHMSPYAAIAAAYNKERAASAVLRETLSDLVTRASQLVAQGPALSEEHAGLLDEIRVVCERAEAILGPQHQATRTA